MPRLPQQTRDFVRKRAGYRCEYCLIPESYHPFSRLHLDHIFSKKHGGKTELSNLALACPECNRKKGTSIGSRKYAAGEFIRLFNPRQDKWDEHFKLDWAVITPKTDIGEITIKILDINADFRVAFREYLVIRSVYTKIS